MAATANAIIVANIKRKIKGFLIVMAISPYLHQTMDVPSLNISPRKSNERSLKNTFNNAPAFPLPNIRKICAINPIMRLVLASSEEITCKPSSWRHALQG
ncbi:MAG: hypothetical protein JRG93_11000 [Deltaproteobacteria bacterium]|nr:hypothetical protein [Deltaproteobacteria bacterium]